MAFLLAVSNHSSSLRADPDPRPATCFRPARLLPDRRLFAIAQSQRPIRMPCRNAESQYPGILHRVQKLPKRGVDFLFRTRARSSSASRYQAPGVAYVRFRTD
jgi:hypothetical protein